MVTVTVSETYDLSTVPDKMGLIGVHTPDAVMIQRQYPGLLVNFKKIQIKSCDIAMACASMLPADPLQIGTDSNDIAPQDMFNPILYRAVSNCTMDQIEARIAGLEAQAGTAPVSVDGDTLIESQANALPDTIDNWSVYYGLLSNRSGWRTAMPQQGLNMRGLRPIVHQKLYCYGQNTSIFSSSSEHIPYLTNTLSTGHNQQTGYINNEWMYGNAQPMPSFNTTALAISSSSSSSQLNTTPSPLVYHPTDSSTLPADSLAPRNSQGTMPYIPRVYVAAIVMPPAKLNRLYYRVTVRWTLEFFGVRPYSELLDFTDLAKFGASVYASDYVEATALKTQTTMVDTNDVDIEKVM